MKFMGSLLIKVIAYSSWPLHSLESRLQACCLRRVSTSAAALPCLVIKFFMEVMAGCGMFLPEKRPMSGLLRGWMPAFPSRLISFPSFELFGEAG
jgi:hypothetical protein